MAKAPKKRPWPAAKVEMVSVDKITPYARNPRKHPPSQIETLKKLIQEFGFTIPLLLDEQGGLIAGEGRLIAAKALSLEEVPCMTAVGWTAAQRRAYVIADNKVSMASAWDDDMLVMELGDLSEDGFDLDLTGFAENEVKSLLNLRADSSEFPSYDENIETEHECPKCGYRFSGGKKAKAEAEAEE